MGLFLATSLLGSISLAFLLRDMETDVLTLLPPELRSVKALARSFRLFSGADRLFVLAKSKDEEARHAFLAKFAERLPRALVGGALYRIDLAEGFERGILPRLPLLLPPETIRSLPERLSRREIRTSLHLTYRRLKLALGSQDRARIAADPLRLASLVDIGKKQGPGGFRLDFESGYLELPDGETSVLLATPRRPATDIAFDQSLRDRLNDTSSSLAGTFPGVSVSIGGGFLTALSDALLMKEDMGRSMALSLSLVAFLFLATFRSLRILLIALAPLVSGILLACLLAYLSGVRLSSASFGFAAMLIGLGIDLAIVFIGAASYLQRTGASKKEVLANLSRSTLPGMATGAATTAVAFLSLLLAGFPGLRQLGVLTAVGILCCLLAMVLLLPALLLQRKRPFSARGGLLQGPLTRLISVSTEKPRLSLILVVVLTLLLLPGLTRLTEEDDLKSLRSPENVGARFEEQLSQQLLRSGESVLVLLHGETRAILDRRLSRVLLQIERLAVPATVESIRDLTPSLESQEDRLQILRKLRSQGLLDPGQVGTVAREEMRAAGFRAGAFDGYLASLDQALRMDSLDDAPAPREGAFSNALVVGNDRAGFDTQLVLSLKQGAAPLDVATRLQSGLPGTREGWAELASFSLAARDIRQRIRRDVRRVVPLGALLVLALVYLDLRRPRLVLLALAPTILGILWMLAAMGYLGIHLNLFNIFVLALVQGIGVDYGIHMVHRARLSGADLGHLSDMAGSLLLAALTTGAGFGSLALSRYPALASMGIVTVLGCVGSLLAAILVIPAAVSLEKTPSLGSPGLPGTDCQGKD